MPLFNVDIHWQVSAEGKQTFPTNASTLKEAVAKVRSDPRRFFDFADAEDEIDMEGYDFQVSASTTPYSDHDDEMVPL